MPKTTTATVIVDDAMSTARAVLSRTLALALITGIDEAKQNDRELTQVQQVDMATMTIMAYMTGMEDFDTQFMTVAMLHSKS